MKKLIDYVMEINWSCLPASEVVDKLDNKFTIVNRQGESATEELIETLVFWEKHTEVRDSLEKFLNDRFILK